MSVQPEERGTLEALQDLREQRRAVPLQETHVVRAGEATYGGGMNRRRQLDGDDPCGTPAQRFHGLSRGGAGLDERLQTEAGLVLLQDVLLHDGRRRDRPATHHPLRVDAPLRERTNHGVH